MNLLIQMKTTKKNFVEKNKYKYKIIYKNKIYPLQNIFKILEIIKQVEKLTLSKYAQLSQWSWVSLPLSVQCFHKMNARIYLSRQTSHHCN